MLSLAGRVVGGELRPPPSDRKIPSWVHQILSRGLSAAPDARYPSMEALVEDLGARLAAERWRTAKRLLPVAVLVLAGVAVTVVRSVEAPAGRILDLCGNGKLDRGEECDDGNTRNDDGCSSACLACPNGAGSFAWSRNGFCYTLHAEPRSWREARAVCAASHSDLLTLLVTGEGQAVQQTFGAREPLWLGLTRVSAGFQWVTSGRATGVPMPWAAGEPRDGGGDCASMNPQGKWATTPCERSMPFVCERPPWRIRARGRHAYRLFSAPATWEQGRATCAAAGGHLVSILDEAEQVFVSTYASRPFWMGANDRRREGHVQWDGGGELSFQVFGGYWHRPHVPQAQDCGLLREDKAWELLDCEELHSFMCEID